MSYTIGLGMQCRGRAGKAHIGTEEARESVNGGDINGSMEQIAHKQCQRGHIHGSMEQAA